MSSSPKQYRLMKAFPPPLTAPFSHENDFRRSFIYAGFLLSLPNPPPFIATSLFERNDCPRRTNPCSPPPFLTNCGFFPRSSTDTPSFPFPKKIFPPLFLRHFTIEQVFSFGVEAVGFFSADSRNNFPPLRLGPGKQEIALFPLLLFQDDVLGDGSPFGPFSPLEDGIFFPPLWMGRTSRSLFFFYKRPLFSCSHKGTLLFPFLLRTDRL